MIENYCPECGTKMEDFIVCRNCGLVIEDRPIDYSSSQMRKNLKLAKKEFQREVYGPMSPNINFMRMGNGRKYYDKNTKEYLYTKAYVKISSICSSLQISKTIRNEALNIYNEMRKKEDNIFLKYGNSACYTAFIRIACKIHDYPISVNELLSYNSQNEHKYNKALFKTKKELNIKFCRNENSFIDKIAAELGIEYKYAQKVREIYNRMKKSFVGNQNNYIIALYKLVVPNLRSVRLSKQFNVTTVTISNKIKEIKRLIK